MLSFFLISFFYFIFIWETSRPSNSTYFCFSYVLFIIINCLYYFVNIFFYGQINILDLGSWISVGVLEINYKFIIDPLSITFGTLIHSLHY